VARLAREAGLPIVPRGAGTGLSGGALPVPGCVVVGLSRMKRILEIDLENGWIRVQPGVANLDVSRAVGPAGYYYAPDPSSQSVCTIGGNVAENSGGAHCLKYGFTVHHVLSLEAVLANGDLGSIILFGSFLAWAVYDRISLKRRSDPGAPPIPVGGVGNDILAVVVGVVAYLALFVALGGTAIAAHHYLLTSTKQISPKVLKKLRGRTGPRGPAGSVTTTCSGSMADPLSLLMNSPLSSFSAGA